MDDFFGMTVELECFIRIAVRLDPLSTLILAALEVVEDFLGAESMRFLVEFALDLGDTVAHLAFIEVLEILLLR